MFPLCGILRSDALTLGFLGGVFLRFIAFNAGFQRVNILLPARVILQCDVRQFTLPARVFRPVFVHIGVLAVDGQRRRVPIAGKRREVLLGRSVIAV